MIYKTKNKDINIDHTLVCAILNVTPDSFSDGGKWFETENAINQAKTLIDQGADVLDIGGESTRPGSKYIQIEEEINRVVPVIKEIRKFSDISISVDTWKAPVAEAALEAGANIINDITGLLGDFEMAEVVARHRAGLIIMFNPVKVRPNNQSSKKFPVFGDNPFTNEELLEFESMDIVQLMTRYFDKSLEFASKAGIDKDSIMLDPGIGFGLTVRENLELIKNIDLIKKNGYMTYLGVSRKRFILNLIEDLGLNLDLSTEEGKKNADIATSFLSAIAAEKGVEAIRVHSVTEHKAAATIGNAIRFAEDVDDIHLGGYKNE